jgi:serine/threonine-protein kinase
MNLPSSGDLIGGKYRVGETIAEGGMGVVVEGVHVQLEDAVAIKFLKPDVVATAGDEVVKRFMREARTAIKIRSEHVVRVFDVDTLPTGVPYMVMERLTGRDLDAILEKSGPLDVTTTIDFVLQALEALAEAHALGIVHRDLKPANLFLSERADGSPCIKVLDFGISKIERGTDGGMTQTQAVMGSPRYMSPEQLRASRDVDARTDIWAMGIVLYELLTGRAPFDGASMTQITAQILETVPDPLALRSEHAAAIERVVMRCLAKKATERFANVAELAAALAPFGSPAAAVSTSRVHGVLNRGGAPPSQPSLPSLPSVQERPPIDRTDVSWEGAKASSSSRLRVGVLAGVAALLTIVGITLGVLTLRRKDEATKSAAVVAAPTTTVPVGVSPAASVLPVLASADPTPAATPKEAPSAAAPTPSDVRPSSVATSRGATPPPARTAPKTRPTTPPTAPAHSASPTPTAPSWSDRK